MSIKKRVVQNLISNIDCLLWGMENSLDIVNLGIAMATHNTEDILSYGIWILIPNMITIVCPQIEK